MRLELTGRHLDITPPLRRLVDAKLAKLNRLLNDSAVSAQAVLTREKLRHVAEITLHARGEKFLHAVGSAATWGAALGQAVDKIAQQAQKMKGKRQERKRRDGARSPAGDGPPARSKSAAPASPSAALASPPGDPRVRPRAPRILKASRQAVKAMTVSEALRDVEAGGDGVVVFRDAETGRISVVYRQRNGDVALVETET